MVQRLPESPVKSTFASLLLQLIGLLTGEAIDFRVSASPGPYPTPAARWHSAPWDHPLRLLDPEGLLQVLSADLLALDLLNHPTGEPPPFTVVQSLAQHPACSVKMKNPQVNQNNNHIEAKSTPPGC